MEDCKNNLVFRYHDPGIADKITEDANKNQDEFNITFVSLLYNVDELIIKKYKEIYGNYPGIPFDNSDVELNNVKRKLLVISRSLKINKIRKCT